MIVTVTHRIPPKEARAMVLRALRQHNYTGKTTEIAAWSELHTSVVRRAGMSLAKEDKLEAVLIPGRGKGEYRFTITQLDLFEDTKAPKKKFPSLKELMDRLVEVKTKLWFLNFTSKFRKT